MKRLIVLLAVLLGLATTVLAQAVNVIIPDPNAAKLDFGSPDQNAVIPVGQAGAGGPVIVSYQGQVFLVGTSSGPIAAGPVIPKTLVTPGTLAPFRLTFAQLGVTGIPPCTVAVQANCPQYFAILAAIGPSNTTVSLVGDSDTFQRAAALPTVAPARPTPLHPVP